MKKLIIAFVFAALPGLGFAAGGGVHLDKANVNMKDQASLQRGAKLFVNYCLSCHSAAYMRFNRMGADLGISEDVVKESMMFTTDKVGDTMTIGMDPADAKVWFGNPPPDLSVIARARGADWLYTYFRSFYVDEKRPFGVNNTVFPDVGMPHVLWELEGLKAPITKTEIGADGYEHTVITGFEVVQPGSMNAAEYDQAARDLTAFLVYMGEPAILVRKDLGVKVLIFLFFFAVLAYLLKKEYWRDVH